MGIRDINRALWAVLSAAAALGWAGPCRADLARSSPFLAPNTPDAGQASGPSGPVELRGVMSTSQGDSYCIYDTAKKTGTWVGINEPGHDFVVKSADPDGNGVTVDFQGRSMRLTLHTSKVASVGPAGSAGPASPPASAGFTPTAVLNPTPADEQRRLDLVAAEVRRRRMEREKAAQGAAANPPANPNR